MSYLKPARKQDNKYLNPVPTEFGNFRQMIRILPEALFGGAARIPARQPGPFHTDPLAFTREPSQGMRVTWFGHSSTLLEIDGFQVLLDPVWSQRASPVQFAGPKRFFAPTLPLEKLPAIDAVVISHDHYDHLDASAVRTLARRRNIRWVTSQGVGRYLKAFGVAASQITEMDWMEEITLTSTQTGAKLAITALPSRHFSGRSAFNRFETLWSSFVLRSDRHNIYYGADSGPWEGFAEIGDRFGAFDLTMLEIGASNAMWESIHLGPDHAAEAHLALKGKMLMPIHWGLFDLALHEWRQPIKRLLEIAPEQGISLFVPEPGQPTDFSGQPFNTFWWQPEAATSRSASLEQRLRANQPAV